MSGPRSVYRPYLLSVGSGDVAAWKANDREKCRLLRCWLVLQE